MMGKIRPMLRSLKKKDLVWRFGSNLGPTVRYRSSGGRKLSALQNAVVKGMNRDGVFVTSIGELFDGDGFTGEFDRSVKQLLESRTADITDLKANLDRGEAGIGSKTFNLECLGSELTFDPASVFARLALHERLLSIANAYLGMTAKLRYYNVWYTAASKGQARESQLWHYDREDNYILKVFIYLDDVDEGTGPFTYAPGTHRKGRYRSVNPEFHLEGGVRRTTDEQMDAVRPRASWRCGTGPKGTVIFADTRGYHKGGEARTRDRLMFTCMYTSPASESRQLLHIPQDLDRSGLSPAQLRALNGR